MAGYEFTFPNPLEADNVKNTKDYGLSLMRAAYERWSKGSGESASSRKNRIEYNRLFAQGKQPMQEYMDILDLDGDFPVINLDFSPLPIAIPFINRLVDRYLQRNEKIQCNAIDPFTQTKKEKAKADALFKLKNKEQIMAIQQEAGVEIEEFSDDDPKDEKELDIKFGFTYKEVEEVIMEQGIDLVLYDNRFPTTIKKRILYDLITAGIAQVHSYIDGSGRIKIRFTKPENIVSGYTEWDDFRGAPYQGEDYMMTISDIRLMYPNKVREMGGEVELWKLAQSNKGINGNPSDFNIQWSPDFNNSIARPYDSFTIEVLKLSFKTLYNLKYESKTDRFGKEVLNRKEVKQQNKKYIESGAYEVEYCGVWIVNTKHVLEWGLAKNQVKPEKNLTEVKLPWVTYMYNNNKMSNTPLIETMIPSIKLMQLTKLQQQKIIAAAAPDGYDVDISQMSDIDLGTGQGKMNPFELYKIYKQTGIRYYKRTGDGGMDDIQRTPPITANNVPFSAKLEQLMMVYNAEYDNLMRIIGTNNLDSGIVTNQAVGKTAIQEARQTGESSSNYIYMGYLDMLERLAVIVGHRLFDILVYGKKFNIPYYEGYVQALGTERIEYIKLQATEDFEKCNFDVKVQAVIDDKEEQLLEQNIQTCLTEGSINLEDAINVRLLAKNNIKYATYFLASSQKKRIAEKREEAMQNSQANTDQAIAAAKASSEGQMQLEQLKSDLDTGRDKQKLDSMKEEELLKFSSIAKTEALKSMLAQGLTIQMVQEQAPWIFQGMFVASEAATMIMEQDIEQLNAEQEQIDAALQQEAMAAQQQQNEPQQMQMQAPQEAPVLQ